MRKHILKSKIPSIGNLLKNQPFSLRALSFLFLSPFSLELVVVTHLV